MKIQNLVPYFVGLFVTGFVFFLAYLIFFMPKIAEAQRIQGATTDQRIHNEGLQQKVSAVMEKTENLPALLKEGELFHASFPQGASQKDLLDSVIKAAGESGVTVSGITTALPMAAAESAAAPSAAAAAASVDGVAAPPAAPATATPAAPANEDEAGSTMATVDLTLNAAGGTAELKEFISKLESLRRPLKIETFSFSAEGGKSSLNITAESYLTAPLPSPS